ncbi:MAG TPA: protocatechuate 3,4-dioxygenase subunit alpha [Polyangiaceae bacterium]
MTRLLQTPSQTAGPFFHLRLGGAHQHRLVEPGSSGAIRIEGRVLDGEGAPVVDALIEIWQADAEGRYVHPADRWPREPGCFTGFGRAQTDPKTGVYVFETRKPGRVPGAGGGLQAPHASLVVFARGLLGHLYSRVYFDDEAAANAVDPVLSSVRADRRGTLVAVRDGRGDPPAYRHDIVLQGPGETVFFDV